MTRPSPSSIQSSPPPLPEAVPTSASLSKSLNHATLASLVSPVGPLTGLMAQKIVKERLQRGAYLSWDDLNERVAGMGAGKENAIRGAGFNLPHKRQVADNIAAAGIGSTPPKEVSVPATPAPPAAGALSSGATSGVPTSVKGGLSDAVEVTGRLSKRRRTAPAKFAGGEGAYWVTGTGRARSQSPKNTPREQTWFAEGSGNARQYASVANEGAAKLAQSTAHGKPRADEQQEGSISAPVHDTVYYRLPAMQVTVTSQSTQTSPPAPGASTACAKTSILLPVPTPDKVVGVGTVLSAENPSADGHATGLMSLAGQRPPETSGGFSVVVDMLGATPWPLYSHQHCDEEGALGESAELFHSVGGASSEARPKI